MSKEKKSIIYLDYLCKLESNSKSDSTISITTWLDEAIRTKKILKKKNKWTLQRKNDQLF